MMRSGAHLVLARLGPAGYGSLGGQPGAGTGVRRSASTLRYESVLRYAWSVAPAGFSTTVGTRFQFVAKPQPGWRGIVDCEILEAREPSLLRYSWVGDENGDPTYVTYRIEPHAGGTRFTYEHTGFTGIVGFLLAKLVLGPVRKKMLRVGLPAVLNDVDDHGALRPASALKPKSLG